MLMAEALRLLEIDALVLGIPDRCLPAAPEEDTGVGALDSGGGRRFLAWVRTLGFTGIQLGPQGETDDGNSSPYDGTIFSRGRLGLAVRRLADADWGALLDTATVARLVAGRPADEPGRISYQYARIAHGESLALAHANFTTRRAAGDRELEPIATRLEAFVRQAGDWLERDALYEVLADAEGGRSWRAWSEAEDRALWYPTPGSEAAHAARRLALVERHADTIERYTFGQFVLHEQHRTAREFARRLGLELWGDLQIGFSDRDAWGRQGIFLPDYRLGAPPSRTNPEGQPWNYPVLDPSEPNAIERFVAARLEKTWSEYDGIRIDHPHGLVCPWVYRADTGDDGVAVRTGARLFSALDLPDHPALAGFAIARREQLAAGSVTSRWDDDWVHTLEPAQVDRYARLFDIVVDIARRHGRPAQALACEVLSTCPYPLHRVLERHKLGRFRVTQKADLRDPRDGYRAENAQPRDWIMIGTHDTAPIWAMLDEWRKRGALRERAAYLAWRLAPSEHTRAEMAEHLAKSSNDLAQAQFADLFASRARHVMTFFTDVFGLREWYNRPGTIDPSNWSLRLPADYLSRYRDGLGRNQAANLPAALAMALRVGGSCGDRADLARKLDKTAVAWRAGDFTSGAA
jgi:4-alpha-glucanotransferase